MNLTWPKSKSVHSIRLPSVLDCLKNFEVSSLVGSVAEKHALIAEHDIAAAEFKKWVSPIIDLSEYGNAYAVNGATDAIHHWLINETRGIQMLAGDYRWPLQVRSDVEVIANFDVRDPSKVLYVSNPSAINGCYRPDWSSLLNSNGPIVLDCAYIGSVMICAFELSANVEAVFFSFSKGMGLSRLRLGWYFSRLPVKSLSLLKQVAYFPALVPNVTLRMCSQLAVDHTANEMRSIQLDLCTTLGIQPSDSFLLGHSSSKNYADWRRENLEIARIPLAHFYSQLGYA